VQTASWSSQDGVWPGKDVNTCGDEQEKVVVGTLIGTLPIRFCRRCVTSHTLRPQKREAIALRASDRPPPSPPVPQRPVQTDSKP